MIRYGYHLTIDGQKVLSITTGIQPDGTHQFFIHTLAGSHGHRHLHGYATLDSQGRIVTGGARLKDGPGYHKGPGVSLSNSTQEIARVLVDRRPPSGPVCTLKKVLGTEWMNTTPSTVGGHITRQEVPLVAHSTRSMLEYSVAMYDSRFNKAALTSEQTLVRFSGPYDYGFVVTCLSSVGSGA